jgi:DNA-binding XRE family transcriptional regulator
MEDMSNALRLLRVYHDMKLSEMAKAIGVSQGYLSEVENGKKAPTLKIVNKYGKVFSIRPWVIHEFAEALYGVGRGKSVAKNRVRLKVFIQKVMS